MILDDLQVIEPPDDSWLTRLRHGHFAWANKERRFVKVEWAWEPPDPGCRSGSIGIRFCWRDGDNWGMEPNHRWYIKQDGAGLDGEPLLLPVRGNCPDEPPPISEPLQRQIQRDIAQLQHRVEQLESKINGSKCNK